MENPIHLKVTHDDIIFASAYCKSKSKINCPVSFWDSGGVKYLINVENAPFNIRLIKTPSGLCWEDTTNNRIFHFQCFDTDEYIDYLRSDFIVTEPVLIRYYHNTDDFVGLKLIPVASALDADKGLHTYQDLLVKKPFYNPINDYSDDFGKDHIKNGMTCLLSDTPGTPKTVTKYIGDFHVYEFIQFIHGGGKPISYQEVRSELYNPTISSYLRGWTHESISFSLFIDEKSDFQIVYKTYHRTAGYQSSFANITPKASEVVGTSYYQPIPLDILGRLNFPSIFNNKFLTHNATRKVINGKWHKSALFMLVKNNTIKVIPDFQTMQLEFDKMSDVDKMHNIPKLRDIEEDDYLFLNI